MVTLHRGQTVCPPLKRLRRLTSSSRAESLPQNVVVDLCRPLSFFEMFYLSLIYICVSRAMDCRPLCGPNNRNDICDEWNWCLLFFLSLSLYATHRSARRDRRRSREIRQERQHVEVDLPPETEQRDSGFRLLVPGRAYDQLRGSSRRQSHQRRCLQYAHHWTGSERALGQLLMRTVQCQPIVCHRSHSQWYESRPKCSQFLCLLPLYLSLSLSFSLYSFVFQHVRYDPLYFTNHSNFRLLRLVFWFSSSPTLFYLVTPLSMSLVYFLPVFLFTCFFFLSSFLSTYLFLMDCLEKPPSSTFANDIQRYWSPLSSLQYLVLNQGLMTMSLDVEAKK